jgi:hypothetical protein
LAQKFINEKIEGNDTMTDEEKWKRFEESLDGFSDDFYEIVLNARKDQRIEEIECL